MSTIRASLKRSAILAWAFPHAAVPKRELAGLQLCPSGVNRGDPQFPPADCTMQDFALSPRDQASGYDSNGRPTASGQKFMIHNRRVNRCKTHFMPLAQRRSKGREIDCPRPSITARGGHS